MKKSQLVGGKAASAGFYVSVNEEQGHSLKSHVADTPNGALATGSVLGIDPGSHVIGYAFLQAKMPRPIMPKHFHISEMGSIHAKKTLDFHQRLDALQKELESILLRCTPSVCAIETGFFGLNAKSALRLGEVRGVIFSCLYRIKIPCLELTPAEVKKYIAGNGQATKESVAFALSAHYGSSINSVGLDASDALAIALTAGLKT